MTWPVKRSWQRCPPQERFLLPKGCRRPKDIQQEAPEGRHLCQEPESGVSFKHYNPEIQISRLNISYAGPRAYDGAQSLVSFGTRHPFFGASSLVQTAMNTKRRRSELFRLSAGEFETNVVTPAFHYDISFQLYLKTKIPHSPTLSQICDKEAIERKKVRRDSSFKCRIPLTRLRHKSTTRGCGRLTRPRWLHVVGRSVQRVSFFTAIFPSVYLFNFRIRT